jgi:hypothetical protein
VTIAVITDPQTNPPETTPLETNPLVEQTLTAVANVAGVPEPDITYQWWHCTGTGTPPDGCARIEGATAKEYDVASTDISRHLAVSVTATNEPDTQTGWSSLTAEVYSKPSVTVTIVGTAAVGERLSADVTPTGYPAPAITSYEWLRCDALLLPPACKRIDGETAASYDVTPADAGFRLAARATVKNDAGEATNESSPSDVVPAPPTRGSNFDQTGTPPSVGPTTTTGTTVMPNIARLRYMRPFPVVRIKGLLVDGGAQVTLLRVTAPRRSKVVVRCRRPGCPLRRAHAAVGRLRPFERFLPAGVRITIRVWRPGRIGKHVRIRIRDGKAPARRDSCVLPGSRQATTCPLP